MTRAREIEAALRQSDAALTELLALVRGECSRLLDGDRGGSEYLAECCENAIEASKAALALPEDGGECERYREALAQIATGAGPFNRDPLKHAENCIESMKSVARAALEQRP